MNDRAIRLATGYVVFPSRTNPDNGPPDNAPNVPCSIAAVGLALASYAVGAERAFLPRADAIRRTLTTLRFFWNSPQGKEPDATGYKGFYYHFLDMKSGRRTWNSELSTMDTTILLAGALFAARLQGETTDEQEITLADALYRRADWRWAGAVPLRSHTDEAVRLSPHATGLQRGHASGRARAGFADPSDPCRAMSLAGDLSQDALRVLISLRGPAVHPSGLPHLVRLP